TVMTLHSFNCSTEGCNPRAGVVQATDGNFYGTTARGGVGGGGTVFKITTGGDLTPLYPFTCGADGCAPLASLIQATDGNLYGTTSGNGGTVFKITTNGVLSTLYSFKCGADGCAPRASLIQALDGNFYGTTSSGGTNDVGTVFRITPTGVVATLHSFDCSTE